MIDAQGGCLRGLPIRPWLAAGKAVLLVGLLLAHFGTRYHVHRTVPLSERRFHPYVYRVSLSLLAGNGFRTFRLSDRPESRPAAEFLSLQRRQLAAADFQAFLASPDAEPLAHPFVDLASPFPLREGDEHILAEPHYTTRVLDLHVAALIWEVFGIRWAPLFVFYALVSTWACLLVFAIARQLGGGFAGGLLAGLFYLASPLETALSVCLIRDISPLWFAALAFAGSFYLVGRFHSPLVNLAATLFVGALATVGCGWRPDALLIAPFLLLSLVLRLSLRGRGWCHVAACALAFLCGVVLTHTLIGALARGEPRMSPVTGFHIACYGESARCNLLGAENTFQVSRDDVQTCDDVQHHHAAHAPGAEPVIYLSSDYGWACLRRYREVIGHNLYRTVSGFPRFYRDCFQACQLETLPINGDPLPAPPPRPAWMPSPVQACLDILNRHAFLLFVLGALVSLLAGSEPLGSGTLLLFSAYNACALFAVLPEYKHAGPLVLPLSVFAGLGTRTILRLVVAPLGWWAAWPTLCARLPMTGVAALLLLAGWGLACGASRWYSCRLREAYLADIEARPANGTPAPQTIKTPSLFSVRIPADPAHSPTGYLLRLRAGKHSARLVCRHVRLPHPRVDARRLTTQHELHPGREQYFFVTCFQGARHGDPRPLICTVLLDGDAQFLDCVRLDLSDWKHGAMSTIFYPGQRTPGNPRVHSASSLTSYRLPGPSCDDGLAVEEVSRDVIFDLRR